MEQRQRVKVERGRKRVRAYLGGEVIADTRSPLLVWEVPYYPMYYFPLDDVHLERLTQTDETTHAPSRGDARLFDVRGGRGVVSERGGARHRARRWVRDGHRGRGGGANTRSSA